MNGRYITCENSLGTSVTFGDDFSPWVLEDADGFYRVQNNVATSDNSNINGSTYYGSTVKTRNIVLTLRDKENHKENREVLYDLFRTGDVGTLSYIEDEDEKTIEYVVESVEISGELSARQAVVSLLCPNPLFQSATEYIVQISEWQNNFEFEHEFDENGEEFGYQNSSMTGEIVNESSVTGTGINIQIDITGTVVNPSIYNIENSQVIKLGDSNATLTLSAGDQIVITTGTGNKHIYLTSGGVTTEINEYLTEDSAFITLMSGTNTIGYTADSGAEYMALTITYHFEYLGA